MKELNELSNLTNLKEIYSAFTKLNIAEYKLWISETILTLKWWFGVGLTILPWFFWLWVRKKESTDRLLHAGFFAAILASMMDITGSALGLWYYQAKVVPIVPPQLPWNFTLYPVYVMLTIQFLGKYNVFLVALIFSSISSFIAEPIAEHFNTYSSLKWEHCYSFPIHFANYLILNYIANRDKFEKL